MYLVVETIEDGEPCCSAVPMCWVESSVLAYPPPRQWSKAGLNEMEPQDSWLKIPCKILTKNPIGMYKI